MLQALFTVTRTKDAVSMRASCNRIHRKLSRVKFMASGVLYNTGIGIAIKCAFPKTTIYGFLQTNTAPRRSLLNWRLHWCNVRPHHLPKLTRICALKWLSISREFDGADPHAHCIHGVSHFKSPCCSWLKLSIDRQLPQYWWPLSQHHSSPAVLTADIILQNCITQQNRYEYQVYS